MMSGLTDIGREAWDKAVAAAVEVSRMFGMTLEVGILDGKGADQQHEGSDLTVVAIAGVHEFGATITVPAHEVTIRRQMVMMDIATRSYKGGKFVKAKKAGYETTHDVEEYNIIIPERSFIRATVDEQRQAIMRVGQELLRKVADGKLKAAQAMRMWGEDVVAKIREKIQKGIAPPLAPSTVRGRAGAGKGAGGDTPLYDTGHLLRSITYRVLGAT